MFEGVPVSRDVWYDLNEIRIVIGKWKLVVKFW